MFCVLCFACDQILRSKIFHYFLEGLEKKKECIGSKNVQESHATKVVERNKSVVIFTADFRLGGTGPG